MKNFVLAASACALILGTATASAQGDVAAGQAKSQLCAACHGPDGNSINPVWPKLAGQHAQYLEKQMRAFRDGTRKDPTMNAMAAPLSDADIQNLAAYYAAQACK